jgi:hypothetical protein
MKKLFLPVLFIILGLAGNSCQFISRSLMPASTGTLDIEIQYTGQWYKDTFNYQSDAPNIRHVALVVPSDVALERAGWVFTGLVFAPSPDPLTLTEEMRSAYGPMLEYLYDAPQGHAVIELAPGKYRLAVAFIAAALPPPDSDATLYPGVTGGGASTEFQEIVIEAGKTLTISIELTDENGWGYVSELAFK